MIFQYIKNMTQPQNSRTTSRRPQENNSGEPLCWKLPSDSCSLGAFSHWHRLGRPEQTLATSAIRLGQCDTAVGLKCAPKLPTANSGAFRLQRSALSFAHCWSKPVLVACSAVHCGHYYYHYCIILIIIVGCAPRVLPSPVEPTKGSTFSLLFLCFSCS